MQGADCVSAPDGLTENVASLRQLPFRKQSGITEAASAAEELRRTMEQIATGAEEAASASQQTLSVASTTTATLIQARQRSESARDRTEKLQGLLLETANQVGSWASNIKHNEERQAGPVAIIGQLSDQAASIGEVTKTVSHVSDETNLLALNAISLRVLHLLKKQEAQRSASLRPFPFPRYPPRRRRY